MSATVNLRNGSATALANGSFPHPATMIQVTHGGLEEPQPLPPDWDGAWANVTGFARSGTGATATFTGSYTMPEGMAHTITQIRGGNVATPLWYVLHNTSYLVQPTQIANITLNATYNTSTGVLAALVNAMAAGLRHSSGTVVSPNNIEITQGTAKATTNFSSQVSNNKATFKAEYISDASTNITAVRLRYNTTNYTSQTVSQSIALGQLCEIEVDVTFSGGI